jgi:hypothetical protein
MCRRDKVTSVKALIAITPTSQHCLDAAVAESWVAAYSARLTIFYKLFSID